MNGQYKDMDTKQAKVAASHTPGASTSPVPSGTADHLHIQLGASTDTARPDLPGSKDAVAGAPATQATGGSGGAGDPPAPKPQSSYPAPKKSFLPFGKKEQTTDDENMTLMDHFRELRARLIKIFVFILIGFIACYAFSGHIADILYKPLIDALPHGSSPSSIIFTGVPEAFFIRMKIAFVTGIFLTSPLIFYQIWAFIAPGLYNEERVFIVPVAIFSAFFFVCGGLFCYYVVFPNAFKFFMSFSEGPFKAMPSMSEYFSFALQLIFAFGLIFELPLFVFFLSRLGIVNAAKMRKFRRYAILISFVVAAVLTPPDAISQLLMAGPMIILYEFSIFIALVFGKKPKTKPEEEAAGKA